RGGRSRPIRYTPLERSNGYVLAFLSPVKLTFRGDKKLSEGLILNSSYLIIHLSIETTRGIAVPLTVVLSFL
ncbi:hypothetical protein, partial [Vibrio cyclitrophicus]|uniref:hypothetical protein n=1 Tax=Vibrio cyclitrophicus TaxID=47951 RepID=UPI0035317E98